MNGYELQISLNETLGQYQSDLDEMLEAGRYKARKAAEFRAALASCELRLRGEGKIPASMVKDVARGDSVVANAEFEAECAEVEYEASREVVMLRKRQVDVLREQIAREWTASGVA